MEMAIALLAIFALTEITPAFFVLLDFTALGEVTHSQLNVLKVLLTCILGRKTVLTAP